MEAFKLLEPHPTGVYSGGAMTELGTVLTVAAGTGIIVDSYTDQLNPVYTPVSWAEQTIDFGSVTDREFSYPFIDAAGVLDFDDVRPDPSALRKAIYLGRAVHDISTGDLLTSRPEHMLPGQTAQMLADFFYAINVPFLFQGGKVTPNADLTYATEDSRWFGPAESWQQDPDDPNIANNPGANPQEFQYIDANGVLLGAATTLVDPTQYEEPLGTIIPIPGSPNRTTIQRLWTGISGIHIMQYGQQFYETLEEAINHVWADEAAFTENPYISASGGTLIAYFVMENAATDLQDGTDVVILDPAGLPIGGGGAGVHTHDATYLRLDAGNDPMLAALDMGNFNINQLAEPLVDNDAATKKYVDTATPHLLYGNPQHTDVNDALALSERHLLAVPASLGAWTPETRLNWRNKWIDGTYYIHDVVTDGSYLMTANKETTDRPAPQPTGAPAFIMPEGPLWNVLQYTGSVFSGMHIGVPAGQLIEVQAVRIWVQNISADAHYQLVIYDAIADRFIIGDSFDGDILQAPGWVTRDVDPFFITDADDFFVLTHNSNSAGTTDFNHPWVRGANTNQDVNPGAGNWTRDNQNQRLRISTTDDDATDRSTELGAVVPGTIIQLQDEADLNAYEQYEVIDVTDLGTWFLFDVLFLDVGTSGNPTIGLTQQVYFEVPIAAPTDYVTLTDHFLNSPNVGGYLAFDSAIGGTDTDDGYGIDIQLQQFSASDDWDLMAVTGGTGGAGGGDGANPLPIGGTTEQALTKIDAADYNVQWTGPYLPLSAGLAKPLTGHLAFDFSPANIYQSGVIRIQLGTGNMNLNDETGAVVINILTNKVTVNQELNLNGNIIRLVADPVQAQDAANMRYVDLFLPLTGGVLSGSLDVGVNSLSAKTLFLQSGGGNNNIELGRIDGSASSPFIDFHSGAVAVDRDVRIIASGGNGSNDGGTLTFSAAAFSFGARVRFVDGTEALPGLAFNDDLATGIYLWGTNVIGVTTQGSLAMRLGPNYTYITDKINNFRLQGINSFPTTSGALNVNINTGASTGQIRLFTSALEFKRNISPLLGLADLPIPEPRQWQDEKSEGEDEQDDTVYVGYAADDWAALDARFGVYSADGRLLNVHDRAIMAVIGAHITALEERVNELENQHGTE